MTEGDHADCSGKESKMPIGNFKVDIWDTLDEKLFALPPYTVLPQSM